MRPLPPTLRENRRYVLFRILGGTVPTQKEVYHMVADSVTALFGDAGAAEMHPAVVWSDGDYVIARCTRGFEQSLIAALSLVTKIAGEPAAFRSMATSGTILSLREKVVLEKPDAETFPGYLCSGKKIDNLSKDNAHRYLTRDDIIKE
ncbi:MAG: Rpp14/Pop5 family protein [Methanocorpusculum sp.]|jgi:ribonuclease P/MRP protein subunit POP5|nr:Rpp14/Pop5 family protein [Methanocorpusculum sp.]MDD3256821.1 Rpp14/Pop5 family protein [Methanocorpusculum sp.]MDD4132576.1 Rpp14/Pop5 family protein [Methanocorpusculum sp.]